MPTTDHRPRRRRFAAGGTFRRLQSSDPVAKAFGPPKPGRGVRVVKDVLPAGKWNVNGEPWNVTPQTLAAIATNYRLAQSRGYAANLGKTHGNESTGLIHPDDLIAPIDDAKVIDGVLWIACYVDETTAAYLANPARKVSIGVVEPYSDGAGNTYPIQLVHVAVTDQPVVIGQGPFRKLSASSAKPKGKPMRHATSRPVPKVRHLAESGAVNAAELQSLLQELLDVLGQDIEVPAFSSAMLLTDFRKFVETVKGILGGEQVAPDLGVPMDVRPEGLAPHAVAASLSRDPAGVARRLAARRQREDAARRNDRAMEQKLLANGIKPRFRPEHAKMYP